jgi:hypothetical protein
VSPHDLIGKNKENGLDEFSDMPYHTPFENRDKAKINLRGTSV